MRALVIFESIFGNTRDVADAIAAGLRDAGVSADAVEVGSAPAGAEGLDLLVVGGPTHAWSMTRANTREDARGQARKLDRAPVSAGIGVREWLEQVSQAQRGARRVAAFDTVVKTKWFPTGSAAKAIAKALTRTGAQVVAKPEHFFVADTHGPLVAGELARARQWGEGVGRRLGAPAQVQEAGL